MTEKAYAKLNLFLHIERKRADGYHDLTSLMTPLALHDTLYFKRRPQKEGIVLTCDRSITEKSADNIVHKVARFILDENRIQSGVAIHIEKRIPVAAGLGGGSADAAAALRGLTRLFSLGYTPEALQEIGAQFGSDIPHCVHNKLTLVKGRGERLTFMDERLPLNKVLLVTPPLAVRTEDIYRAVDIASVPGMSVEPMLEAIRGNDGDALTKTLYNALEPFTLARFDAVADLKKALEAHRPDAVLMCGSGPTIAVFTKDRKKRTRLRDAFCESNHVIETKIKK